MGQWGGGGACRGGGKAAGGDGRECAGIRFWFLCSVPDLESCKQLMLQNASFLQVKELKRPEAGRSGSYQRARGHFLNPGP